MDTDAFQHMTLDLGILNPYFNLSTVNSILVGNGNSIHVLGSRSSSFLVASKQYKLNQVDHWQTHSYMGITCHYIDEFHCLHKRVLAFRVYDESHIAQNISRIIYTVLTEYRLV